MTTRRMNANAPTSPVIWLGETRVSVAVVIADTQCMPFRHLSNRRAPMQAPKPDEKERRSCARPAGP